jgi:predicted AAA+ superfamily ATPase
MSKGDTPGFARAQVGWLADRLMEPRRYLQVVAGPRQVGKTTLVRQALVSWGDRARYASADEPTVRDRAWLIAQWEAARLVANEAGDAGAVLALDEIQKVSGWSETVKSLWDEDTRRNIPLRVVLLGSAPLLVQRGLSESLAGRFERIAAGHWSLTEMRDAFGLTVDEYIFFGGYPGAVPLVGDPQRWIRYLRDALIETTLSRDVLLLTRVDKPALLRRLFELGCRYSGQVLSYTKMVGQLQDAGNTTTLAHYLELLAGAGMLTGLQKFSGSIARSRGSSPKLQVMNTGLMTATLGLAPAEVRAQPEVWGRLVESAIGAHLAGAAAAGECALYYWRDRNREVDFVVESSGRRVAIEVKSGRRRDMLPGLEAFATAFEPNRVLLVGADGISVEEFLSKPVDHWVKD